MSEPTILGFFDKIKDTKVFPDVKVVQNKSYGKVKLFTSGEIFLGPIYVSSHSNQHHFK